MENRDIDYAKTLEIRNETLRFKDVTVIDIYNHLYDGTSSIILIDFNQDDIDLIKSYFPLLNIEKENLKGKIKLALNIKLYNKIYDLCTKSYPKLQGNIKQITLIIYFSSLEKFKNKGAKSYEYEGLINLAKVLSEMSEREINVFETTIKEPIPKYSLEKIKLEFKSITNSDQYKLSIKNESNLSTILKEAFEYVLSKYKISHENSIVKVNTNHLFCQQFFKFINETTEFSTKGGFSEREILTFFTYIYKFTGHKFSKTSDEVEIVEKWLKPSPK